MTWDLAKLSIKYVTTPELRDLNFRLFSLETFRFLNLGFWNHKMAAKAKSAMTNLE